MNEWWKDPKILIIGGVAAFAGFILLRNQNSSSTPSQTNQTNNPQGQNTVPVGGSYTYLDGNGVQHMTMTDPYGAIQNYNTTAPTPMFPQTNQLATYVGGMSPYMYSQPYGGTTPYYSQPPQLNTYMNTPDPNQAYTSNFQNWINYLQANYPWNTSTN